METGGQEHAFYTLFHTPVLPTSGPAHSSQLTQLTSFPEGAENPSRNNEHTTLLSL